MSRFKIHFTLFMMLTIGLSTYAVEGPLSDSLPSVKASSLVGEGGKIVNENSKGKISKLLYSTVVTSGLPATRQEIERRDNDYFLPFNDRIIGSIYINRKNVVANPKTGIERTINNLHILTREKQIREDLLFDSGDNLNPEVMSNTRQLLRSRNYISTVSIDVVPTEQDSMVVDIYVNTSDTWTISANGSLGGDGKSFFELYDNNLLGAASRLNIRNYFDWKDAMKYGGLRVEYEMTNILGTFFDGGIVLGRGFDRYEYGVKINKDFVRRADYAGGLAIMRQREPIRLFDKDTVIDITYNEQEIWYGQSLWRPGADNSLYWTGRYNDRKYTERPEVSERLNPYFHNSKMLLLGLGFYRERFKTNSLLYGYGVNEYLAYGYRWGLTSGYSWGEFGDRWYVGFEYEAGYFLGIGYLGGSIAAGSYLNQEDGNFYRTALVANLNYVSHLLGKGRYQVRQFVNVNVTRGWNRLDGYAETTSFSDETLLLGLPGRVYGRNRVVAKSETVVFTPWNLYQFRFALFGYADMGLIGDHSNMLRNRLHSTIGIGVRIKNEHLIFNTITIRLGIALGPHGFMNTDYINVSNSERSNRIRYIPEKPSEIDYR